MAPKKRPITTSKASYEDNEWMPKRKVAKTDYKSAPTKLDTPTKTIPQVGPRASNITQEVAPSSPIIPQEVAPSSPIIPQEVAPSLPIISQEVAPVASTSSARWNLRRRLLSTSEYEPLLDDPEYDDYDISDDDADADSDYVLEEESDFELEMNLDEESELANSHPVFRVAGEENEEEEEVEAANLGDLLEDMTIREGEEFYTARKGHVWSTKEEVSARTRRDIVTESSNLNGAAAEAKNHVECFNAYLSQNIMDIIITFTNKYAQEYVEERPGADKNVNGPTDEIEMRAFFGILITMGFNNDTKEDISTLWSETYGKMIYRAAMSINRFKALLKLVRFDDVKERRRRKRDKEPIVDNLAAIREVFDALNNNLRTNYTPGPDLCIDEMLCLFRGGATFRVYIKSKPGKYGLLLRMLSDVKTKIILQIDPYGGKLDNVVSRKPLEIVMDLLRPYFNSNRNVTMDRYFTSVDLATKLYNNKITLVGTVNSNRLHLPEEVKVVGDRELHSTLFVTSKKPTSGANVPIMLASYVSKIRPKKIVILMSTMHSKFTVHDQYRGKPNKWRRPEITEFYNTTMGAVDTDDHMARRYKCKRETRRWPLSWFFSVLDICALNAYFIYCLKDEKVAAGVQKRKHCMRLNFYRELAEALIQPNAARRLETSTNFSFSLKQCITTCFKNLKTQEEPPPPPEPNHPSTKKRCKQCWNAADTSKKKNSVTKVITKCRKCQSFCCKKHQRQPDVLCTACPDI